MPQPIPVKHQFLSETRSNYIRIWSLQQAIGYWVNDKLKKSAGLLFQDTPALAKNVRKPTCYWIRTLIIQPTLWCLF